MNRRFRLTRSGDFQRVRRLGKSYAHPLIVLIVLPGQEGMLRVGVAAGRAVGKAVRRNRAKRLLRAAIQPHLQDLVSGRDMVLIARRPMAEATFQQTQAALYNLLRRSGLFQKDA